MKIDKIEKAPTSQKEKVIIHQNHSLLFPSSYKSYVE